MFAHYLTSHLLTVITAVASVVMVVHLLSTRRAPQSLLAWVLALAFVPLAAIPLYFLIGTRKFPKRSRGAVPLEARSEGALETPVARVLRAVGAPPSSSGNRIELLGDGERGYARLMELIGAAERSIHLSVFILGADPTGTSVVLALAARARAGVNVRVIVDAVGSAKSKKNASRILSEAGGSLRTFMPLLHAPLRGRNNLRSHRKLGVIDGRHVFLGGMNIAETYMGKTPLPGRWRDLAAIASGPIARDAEALFESDWSFCGGADRAEVRGDSDTPAPAGDARVQLVQSGPDMTHDTFYDAILTALFGAKERVVIVSPYYVPDDVVQRAIVLAARRGVRTEIVLPARSNHTLADFARRGLLRELSSAGAVIRVYPKGMMHAKAMIVDDTFAYVGSPNMDMRSFFLNYEAALCIYTPDDVARVREWAESLLSECTEDVTRSRREFWLLEQFARLIAPEL